MKRLWWSALLLVGTLAGCAPKELNYAVKIVTQSCMAGDNPFDGVKYIRVKVTGPEMTPKLAISPVDSGSRQITLPEIPVGNERVIEVRAYDGDPEAGAKVISAGSSLPFDVPEAVPEELWGKSVEKTVVLRKVGAFVPVVNGTNPSECQKLMKARAGHSATLLKNGKVLIAGGFNFQSGTVVKEALASTEVFDPESGTFTAARPISSLQGGTTYEFPRAYHSAALLPSGQVNFWGGETYSGGTNNTTALVATIVTYDVETDTYIGVGARTPPSIPRSRHSAAVDVTGKVLIVGGITRSTTNGNIIPVDQVEWFDATTNLYKIVEGVTLPRLGAVVMPVKKGEFIAVAGGTDGAALRPEIAFFKFAGTTFGQQSLTTPPRLAGPGRRAAAGALLRDGADLILLGGYSDVMNPAPLASSEVLTSSTATVSAGPDVRTPRGDICAVTLKDGTVLAIGGRTSESGGPAHADDTSVLVTPSTSGGISSAAGPNLPKGRYHHTCTALRDGSVLVTGGINETTGGVLEVLQDVYIYTPVPPAD